MKFATFCAWLLALVAVFRAVEAAAFYPQHAIFLYRPDVFDGVPPADELEVASRLGKRAVKRERILDALGGDYLVRKRTL